MNTLYPETKHILDALGDIIDPRHISIFTENTSWRGRPYRSDYVIIEQEHNIGFEVFHNEIIACYFGDHTYSIVQNIFDEDDLFWCWTPMEGSGVHLFDTEEKAIHSAKKELNI